MNKLILQDCEYFEVKNFKQFQHYSKRNPPWVRLYYSILDDERFLSLDNDAQRHYMVLILIASRCDNKISNNPNYLKRVMRLDSEPDLKPLFKTGFLLAHRKRRASTSLARHDTQNNLENSKSLSETEVQKYRSTDNSEAEKSKTVSVKPKTAQLSYDEFIQKMKESPVYKGLDIDKEMAKLDNWLLTPKGRGKKKTHARIINWLSKAESELPTQPKAKPKEAWRPPVYLNPDDPIAPIPQEAQKVLDKLLGRGKDVRSEGFQKV